MQVRRLLISVVLLLSALLAPAQAPLDPSSVAQLATRFSADEARRHGPLFQELKQRSQGPMGAINLNPSMELVGVEPSGELLVYKVDNLIAAQSSHVEKLWTGGESGYNLDGSTLLAQNLGVWDAGKVRTSHQEFGGRATQYDGALTNHYHATHVAGTMIAEGINPSAQGMAWEAQLRCYDWNNDNNEMLTAATNAMLVSNHSYGLVAGWDYNSTAEAWYWYGTASVSETEDYKFGNYNSWVRAWDEIAYTAPLYLIVKSAGNDRNDTGPTPGGEHYVWGGTQWVTSTTVRDADGGSSGYDSIPAKGVAKNVLTIGAVEDIPSGYSDSTDVVMTAFSGWGPCDDGRIKPDLVANGVSLTSTAETSNSAYITLSGTSMASPTAAGIAGLMVQQYRSTHSNQYPRAATTKAVLIHSAGEAGDTPGPDYQFGWGMIDARAGADLIELDQTIEWTLQQLTLTDGDTLSDTYYAGGLDTLKVTLVWSDPPGPAQGAEIDPTTAVLMHDLDLRLVRLEDGIEFEPWMLDKDNPADAATTGDNTVDNVEQVYLTDPEPGNYDVRITHKGTLAANQLISLVITGFQGPGIPAVATDPDPSDGATAASIYSDLNWEQGTGGDPASEWDVYFGDDSTLVATLDNSLLLVSSLDGGTTTIANSALNGGDPLDYSTTYWWRIISRDGEAETNTGSLWSFSTPASSAQVTLSASSDGGLIDSDNLFGFASGALDTYDAFDIPEPPILPTGYLSLYFDHSSWNPEFTRRLAHDYRNRDTASLLDTPVLFSLLVETNVDATVTLTLDPITGNVDEYGVLLWDGDASSFQNVFGAEDADATVSFTADGTPSLEQKAYSLLYGDRTAPELTLTSPPADGSGIFYRGSNNTITIDPDDSSPLREVIVALSDGTEGNVGDNGINRSFTTLSNGTISYSSPDDPTDGIYNPVMSWSWNPVGEDPDLVAHGDSLPDAQLRFTAEDWMGNTSTTYVNVAILPDEFEFDGDYALGWHLISIPLLPDNTVPLDAFATVESGGEGIYGDYEMFEYTVPTGLVHPPDLNIGEGYWLVLDQDNTTAASNAGLGTIYGTSTQSMLTVDYALTPDELNLVGIPLRGMDLSTGALQADDWLFSDDSLTWYSWAEATSATNKGGDSNIWINPVSLKTYDNVAGDYGPTIAEDADLEPGVGYSIEAGTITSGELYIRTDLSAAEADGYVEPGRDFHVLDELNEFTGEWFIPIHIELNGFYNEMSGLGSCPGAFESWDLRLDVNQPPPPPSGRYVRAIVDGQEWGAPFGRYFVRDIRPPFDFGTTEVTWHFKVYASEHGAISMTFDTASLEQFQVPAGFRAEAVVNGETFDLLDSQTIQFDYSGGLVPVRVEASLDLASVPDTSILPKAYGLSHANPNPFNPTTTLRVALPTDAKLTVTVFNILGQKVTVLADRRFRAGYHTLLFDGSNLASGIYFVHANVPGKLNQVRRVLLLR
ncbi:S8 family serine peptidase [bacterium]|nr:S8 family serine peptidase [bacterium]